MSSSVINYDQSVDIFDILILSDYLEGIYLIVYIAPHSWGSLFAEFVSIIETPIF